MDGVANLGDLREQNRRSAADQQVGRVADCRVAGHAREGVTAAALQPDGQFGGRTAWSGYGGPDTSRRRSAARRMAATVASNPCSS